MSENTFETVPDDLKPLGGEALDDAKFAYDTRVALSLGTPLPQKPNPALVPPYKAHLDAYLADPENVDGSSSVLLPTANDPAAPPAPEKAKEPEKAPPAPPSV